MRLPLLLLLLTLALLVAGVPQQRSGRRGSSSRGRPVRPPGGSSRVMAVQAARVKAENDPDWLKCENSVQEVPLAEHIVTARVDHVGAITSRLEIKRSLKGAYDLPTHITISTCSDTCCALRRRDTRIFLLGQPVVSDGEEVFPQVAPPLGITLKTLGLIWAAATDAPYEPRPPIEEEPCEQQFCAWGGECVTDEEGVATCACPTSCPPPSSTTSPVCGTDGNTYTTICELRRHACRTQQETRIRHSGSCDDPAAAAEEGDLLRTRAMDRGTVRDRSTTTTTTTTTTATTTTTTRSPDRN